MRPAGDKRRKKVVIAGAGIAGMTAALYLLEAGLDVTVLEKRDHVGGKFGAIRKGPYKSTAHEHAYHFLGDWCANLWEVAEKIGLTRSHLRPSRGVSFLRPRKTGGSLRSRLTTLRLEELGSLFSENLYCGVIPPDDMMIWFYSLLDLVTSGRDLDEKEFLNRISVNGFMRSLPYMTDLAALLHQEALMKAFSIPSYDTSVRSYRRFARFFSRDQDGRILKRPVDADFWRLFMKALEHCKRHPILFNTSLVKIKVKRMDKGPEVSCIHVKTKGGKVECWDRKRFGHLLITVPHLDLASIVEQSPTLLDEAPGLLELRKLKSKQMASLDVYFKRPLAEIPREHVTLIDDTPFTQSAGGEGSLGTRRQGSPRAADARKSMLAASGNRMASRFALSFVDNYQGWNNGRKDQTWLNVVSADFEELANLSKEEAQKAILRELAKYLEFTTREVDMRRTDLQLNDDAPLFTNTVGSWQYRPNAGVYKDSVSAVEFKNLYLAGDYCRSEVDVVCLEGAVLTARRAARAIAEKEGCADKVPEPVVPAEVSDQQVEQLKQDLEPWLRLATRGGFGASARLALQSEWRRVVYGSLAR